MPGESSTSPTGLGYTDYSVYHDYARIADIPDQSNYYNRTSSSRNSGIRIQQISSSPSLPVVQGSYDPGDLYGSQEQSNRGGSSNPTSSNSFNRRTPSNSNSSFNSNSNSNLSSNSKSKNLSNVCDSSNVDNLSKPDDSSKPPGSSIIETKEGRDLEKINRILYTTNPIKNKLGRVGFSSGYEMSIDQYASTEEGRPRVLRKMGEQGTHRTGLTRRSRLDYLMRKNVNSIRKPLSIIKSTEMIINKDKLNNEFIKSNINSLETHNIINKDIINSLETHNNINKDIESRKKHRKIKNKNNLKWISKNIHRKIRFGLLEKDRNGKYMNFTRNSSDVKENLPSRNKKDILQKHKGIKSNSKPKIVSVSTSFNPATVTD